MKQSTREGDPGHRGAQKAARSREGGLRPRAWMPTRWPHGMAGSADIEGHIPSQWWWGNMGEADTVKCIPSRQEPCEKSSSSLELPYSAEESRTTKRTTLSSLRRLKEKNSDVSLP